MYSYNIIDDGIDWYMMKMHVQVGVYINVSFLQTIKGYLTANEAPQLQLFSAVECSLS